MQRLIDLEPGRVLKDAEAEADALCAEVGGSVVYDPQGEGDEADNQKNLENDAADPLVIEHGVAASDRSERQRLLDSQSTLLAVSSRFGRCRKGPAVIRPGPNH